jgi:hypothetical protein
MKLVKNISQGRNLSSLSLSTGIERSWTVADESPGGTETTTTTILNEIPEIMYQNDRA